MPALLHQAVHEMAACVLRGGRHSFPLGYYTVRAARGVLMGDNPAATFQPCEQLFDRSTLDDVIIRACVQAGNDIAIATANGEQQHVDIRIALECSNDAAELEAIHLGH